jgi:cobalt/nickel transport system ATP-binding protein
MPTVYEDVAFGPANLGLPPEEIETRVAQALETVGAGHLRDRMPCHLSGGEKRSVAIATVLSMLPDILVLDEPTSNLDPRGRRQVLELLKTFKHTKIIATHDLDMILDLCERTIVIHEGQVTADGLTEQIFADTDLLTRSHLEKPFRMQACPICGKERK